MLAIVPSSVSFIQVISAKPCSVQYIDYQCLIKRCSKACPWHSLLVNNVLLLITQKAVHLTERLEVLSQRTTREKLLCYFSLTASHCGSNSFQLPFSLSTLADYLSVDRSAMMRENKKVKGRTSDYSGSPLRYIVSKPIYPIIPARKTLLIIPAMEAMRAPKRVYLVFVTFAVTK